MWRITYIALFAFAGLHITSLATAQTNNPYVGLFPDCKPKGTWGFGSGADWPYCDAAKAEAARRGISVEQAYAEAKAAELSISVEELIAEVQAARELDRALIEEEEARREEDRAEAKFWGTVILAFAATVMVAIIVALFMARRKIATNLSRRWRKRSKDFRIWVFGSFFWASGTVLYVWLARPYGSRMYGEDFDHMLAVTIVPPLFFGALWFSYKRFVK